MTTIASSSENAKSTVTWDELPNLDTRHRAELIASNISPAVAKERGYQTVTTKIALTKLGFRDNQGNVPGWLAPVFNVAGEVGNYTYKPDQPRIDKDGHVVKYEGIPKRQSVLDIPRRARPWVMDAEQAIFITEGAKKADAGATHELACVSIPGVWNWRSEDIRAAFDLIPLKKRTVYLVFDSDWRRKSQVKAALRRLTKVLIQYGAIVFFLDLPEESVGIKVGLDDFFANGGDSITLLRHAAEAKDLDVETDDDDGGLYSVRDGCLCYRKRDPLVGDVWIPLCNFKAQIAQEVIADDGLGERGFFVIHGALADGTPLPSIEVPFAQFSSLNWVTSKWGARANVYAGFGTKERVRDAIQRLSADTTQRRVYAHPGWRQIAGTWVYLHADGAIGPRDTTLPEGIEVRLDGAAARLSLPIPPTGDDAALALRDVLAIRDIAPDRISAPLLGAAFFAPLCEFLPVDTLLYLAAPSGSLKSELNALTQRFFGPDFDRTHPPGNFTWSGNALEKLASDFKDAICWIDDFAPSGSAFEMSRYHALADRVFRGVGNRSGRGRLTAELGSRPEYVPRGFVVSSGEDIPRGHSLRARALISELTSADVNLALLSRFQIEPGRGQLRNSMAVYVEWLATQAPTLRATLAGCHRALRDIFTGTHLRTPDALAYFAVAWKTWLRCAVDVEALTQAEADDAWQRAIAGLMDAGREQHAVLESERPVERFRELLMSAISRGDAHVADANGDAPSDYAKWGWTTRVIGQQVEHVAHGKLVGWLDADGLYVDLPSAYKVAQDLAGSDGRITVGVKTLAKRLDEARALVTTGAERKELTIRKQLQGARRRVHHLSTSYLSGKSGQSGQSGQSGTESADADDENPSSSEQNPSSPKQNPSSFDANLCLDGRIGRIGRISPLKKTPSDRAHSITMDAERRTQEAEREHEHTQPLPSWNNPSNPSDPSSTDDLDNAFGPTCLACGGVLLSGRKYYCVECDPGTTNQ